MPPKAGCRGPDLPATRITRWSVLKAKHSIAASKRVSIPVIAFAITMRQRVRAKVLCVENRRGMGRTGTPRLFLGAGLNSYASLRRPHMDDPFAISLAECARLLSVTRKHIYTLIDTDPDFPRIFKLGRCTRVMRSEVLQYIANKAKGPVEVLVVKPAPELHRITARRALNAP